MLVWMIASKIMAFITGKDFGAAAKSKPAAAFAIVLAATAAWEFLPSHYAQILFRLS
jgi:hypothetical protein